MFAYMWPVTGHQGSEIVIGKKSGKDNIADYLVKLGLIADPEQSAEILKKVKEKAYEVNRALTEQEFRDIHNKVTSS